MPASLPDLHVGALQAIVDAGCLTPTDVASLACTTPSLAATARDIAPASVRLRATSEAARWLAAGDRAAAVTRLWVDVPRPRPQSAGSADDGAAVIAALIASGAAPRLARLDVVLPPAPDAPALPSLALAAWLPPRPNALRHLGVHGACPDASGVNLSRLTSLALDACHASPLSAPFLDSAAVAALDLPNLTPNLLSLDIREGLLVGDGRPLPPLPPSVTHVRWRAQAAASPPLSTGVAALLAALPRLASLDVGASASRGGGGDLGAPPSQPIDLALAATQPAGAPPLPATLHPRWLADCLTRLTLTHWAPPSGVAIADLGSLSAATRLVDLTLVDAGRVTPAPPSLTTSLTSLSVRLARRRAATDGGVRVAWPDGGFPALRRLECALGASRLELTDPHDAPLPPAAVDAAGTRLASTLRSITFVAGGAAAAGGWRGLQAAVLSRLRPPLALNATVPPPPPADVASPAAAPYDGVLWPVAVAATEGEGVSEALACVTAGLPSYLRAALFARGAADRGGAQAAVAALGRVPLAPDEV